MISHSLLFLQLPDQLQPGQIELILVPEESSTKVQSENLLLQNPETENGGSHLSAYWPISIQRWADLIVKWADQYVIDPDLIAAIMLVESGGDPDAVSSSGACGLMQIMARDTATVKPWLFRNRPTCKELKDADRNIGWAVHYLAVLYHYYGDDWREALFHYGPIDREYKYADLVLAYYVTAQK